MKSRICRLVLKPVQGVAARVGQLTVTGAGAWSFIIRMHASDLGI